MNYMHQTNKTSVEKISMQTKTSNFHKIINKHQSMNWNYDGFNPDNRIWT